MGGTCKNDVKTLFFISNSFNAVFGLALFSSGVGHRVLQVNDTVHAVCIVVGLLYIAVVSLAYVAASAESDRLLRTYITVMTLKSIFNVTSLARWDGFDPNGDVAAYRAFYSCMIGDTIVTMVSVLLSFTLAVQQRVSAEVTSRG